MRIGIVLLASVACISTGFAQTSPNPEAATPSTDPSYRLVAGDLIAIRVYGEPDLDASQRLDASGRVRLPLLGEVPLASQSVRSAEKTLEQLYLEREYLKAPLISIAVVSFALREVSILGAVRQPGNFQFPKETAGLDIVDLITRVGGFLPVARANLVKVTRRAPDGEDTISTVDVESMISGRKNGSAHKDFQVLPGDRIWIPERLF